MYILHIETSTSICSAALSKDQVLLAFRDGEEDRNHAEVLAPAISDLLREAGIKPTELDAISVSSGPGSFTGLRVGSSTAKAMAYALNKLLIPVPTLNALAQAAFNRYPEADMACPMLDARRNEVYLSLFERDMNAVIPVSSVILEDQVVEELLSRVGIVVCCGNGAHKLSMEWKSRDNIIVDENLVCHARHLIQPAWEMVLAGKKGDPMSFVPHYLKPANITQPRKV
jgi:tRNA threonylcarbamoyladenosine biosynthesis protein TsaB